MDKHSEQISRAGNDRDARGHEQRDVGDRRVAGDSVNLQPRPRDPLDSPDQIAMIPVESGIHDDISRAFIEMP